ncbi:MAG: polyprenyl diphosphate synthase [Nitrososphaerota archaeon]
MLSRLLKLFGVYWIYERWLRHIVLSRPLPKHIAIIVDGNRRWATRRGWPPWVGHRYGADRLEEILEDTLKMGVETITLFALSTENMRRKPEEVGALLSLIKERAEKLERSNLIHSYKVRVRVLGRKEMLPPDVRAALERLERKTSGYSRHFLNLAVAYGGRGEIVDAVRSIALKVKNGLLSVEQIDEKTVEESLYTRGLPHPEPELIIRTSGEVRISNFLLWQSAYSELVFIDVNFPDFRFIDLLRAIRTFQQRSRRFGL